MTEVEANRAIFARFLDQWPTLSGGVAYVTENNTLSQPSATTFARINVDRLGSFQHTMGGVGHRKFERVGAIEVLLVGPMGVGSEPLLVLAQHVRAMFESTRLGSTPGEPRGVVTEATDVRAVRNHPEYAGCAVVVARTPFQYLETR